LLLVILLPWQRILVTPPEAPASSSPVPGIVFFEQELVESVKPFLPVRPEGTAPPVWQDYVMLFARFAAYPLAGVILLVVIVAKTRRRLPEYQKSSPMKGMATISLPR
jgi:hypothetical protein